MSGLAALAAFAAAALAPGAPDGFSGTCAADGRLVSDPPVVLLPRQVRVAFEATGTCSGTLGGRRVRDAPVQLRAELSGEGACVQVHVRGTGELRFTRGTTDEADDHVVGLHVDAPVHPTGVLVRGARTGAALASALFTATDEPLTACLGSGGVAGVRYRLTLATLSPLS